MEFLHLGSPGDKLWTFEQARVIEGANLDENSTRRPFGTGSEVDAASRAKVPGGRPRKIILVEGARSASGKLERLRGDGHEEISCAARDHLTCPTVAKPSEAVRFFASVADFATVASTCKHVLSLDSVSLGIEISRTVN